MRALTPLTLLRTLALSLALGLALGLAWLGSARAQDVLPVPELTARVIDQTGTLQPDQSAALEAKLAAFEAEAGPQIVLLLVPATAPEDIAAYAQRVADTWKIGRREVGDGVLVVVAKDERRVRIEVAKALEGAVPDLAARQIIDRAITPAFRAGDFAGGLSTAVDALMARIKGEGLPLPEARAPQGPQDGSWQELLMFFFVAVPVIGGILSKVLGRKLGALVTAGGAGAAAWIFSASLLIAGAAALLTMLVVGILGVGAMQRGIGRGTRRGGPVIWGGGVKIQVDPYTHFTTGQVLVRLMVGVDILEKMVERSRERASREGLTHRVEFRVADAQNLPFEDNLFDAVLTESVTAFPADKQKAVSEYARVTKPGGYVGLNETAWLKVPPPPEVIAWAAQDVGASVKPLTPDEWVGLLDAAGLKEITAQVHAVDIQDEAKGILQRYGWAGMLRILGRTLLLYAKSPSYRDFVKRVRQGGIVPDHLNEYLGYGLFIGRKE